MWVTIWIVFGVVVCFALFPVSRVLRRWNVSQQFSQRYTQFFRGWNHAMDKEDADMPKPTPKEAPKRAFSWRYCWSHLLVVVGIPLVATWILFLSSEPRPGHNWFPAFCGTYIYLQAGPFVAVVFLLMMLARLLGVYGWGLIGLYLYALPIAIVVRWTSFIYWFRRPVRENYWDRLWLTAACQTGITVVGNFLISSDFYYLD